jgi:hypothetical protein
MTRLTVNRDVLFLCGSLILYYFIMEMYYIHFIGVEYLIYGFNYDPNLLKYFETKVIFLVMLVFSIFISKASEFIYSNFVLLLIFFLVPTLVIYSYSNHFAGPLYSIVALMVGVGTISVGKLRIPRLHSVQLSHGVVIFMLILVLVPFLINFGIHFNANNLLLADIEQTRDFFEQNASPLIDYLYNWLVKALIPLLLVFFLINKKRGYAFITFLTLLYLYVISGNKIVYITVLVVLFFYFFGDDYFRKIRYFTICLIIGLSLLPLVDYFVLHSHSLKGVFVMRMLFLPSQLNYFYFDFFSESHLYFAESNFFKFFVEYPFDKPIGYIISETYFRSSGMNANNGIVGDGYMNLGYPGVALNILIVSVIFLFFNSMQLDSRYMGIFFVMIFLFLSVPMLSMFLTSGLWIIFIMGLTVMRNKSIIA